LPQGIVAQAIATATFPTLASLEARGEKAELRRMLTVALRGVLFLTIPAAAGLFVWRTPLLRLLLERGAFSAQSTEMTAIALAYYAFGLIGHSAVEIVARAFYALHDTRTPVAVIVGGMALNILLSLALREPMGYAGLALANTIAVLLETVVLVWLLARRLDGLEWPQLWSTIGRSTLAAAIMALPLGWAAERWGDGPALLVGGGGLAAGGLLYLMAAVLLRMPELRTLRRVTAS
jgi:putative peptidoglycan lipid II flippase